MPIRGQDHSGKILLNSCNEFEVDTFQMVYWTFVHCSHIPINQMFLYNEKTFNGTVLSHYIPPLKVPDNRLTNGFSLRSS